MKLIIAGSRDLGTPALQEAFAQFPQCLAPDEVVSGCARGIDTAGEDFAEAADIPIRRFPARWGEYGDGAGYIRNEKMAAYADALLAVWDGKSRGTQNMIHLMRMLGKPVYLHTTETV